VYVGVSHGRRGQKTGGGKTLMDTRPPKIGDGQGPMHMVRNIEPQSHREQGHTFL